MTKKKVALLPACTSCVVKDLSNRWLDMIREKFDFMLGYDLKSNMDSAYIMYMNLSCSISPQQKYAQMHQQACALNKTIYKMKSLQPTSSELKDALLNVRKESVSVLIERLSMSFTRYHLEKKSLAR